MKGKKALVTGASRGIGKGIAFSLAAQGCDLAISHYEDDEAAEEVRLVIEEDFGRKCAVFQVNLEEEHTPGKLVQHATEALGEIHVLVNNAGATFFSDITKMELKQINKLIHLDFRAPLLTMQAAGRHMKERNIAGSIVNITSTRAERAYPADAVYGGVKSALTRATQSIALELAPYRIRVNCIAPGAIQAWDSSSDSKFYRALGEKIPLGRSGTPDDIGNAVVWLCSDGASYITGASIRVDGGLILPGMPETVDRDDPTWGAIHDATTEDDDDV